jgi:hypothetical protein
MAKKATARPRSKSGAKAAMADHSKDGTSAQQKKAAFGKRRKASGAAHAASAVRKSTTSNTMTKPARKSTIGKVVDKAVGAVSSTVSSVAGQATSLFKRRAEKSR